jgi:TATA-binding protein-associated factor Taf7
MKYQLFLSCDIFQAEIAKMDKNEMKMKSILSRPNTLIKSRVFGVEKKGYDINSVNKSLDRLLDEDKCIEKVCL